MKTWADFYDYYLTDLSGCSLFAAQNELRRAAQEFFERTGAWRFTLDPVMTVGSVSVYDLDLSKEMDLVKVIEAKLDGKAISLLTADEDTENRDAIKLLNAAEFELYPTPTGSLTLNLKAIVKPSATSTGIEDHLFSQYAEQIAFGAKARLMAKKDKQYSDPGLSAVNREWFNAAIGTAKHKAANAYSKATRRNRTNF